MFQLQNYPIFTLGHGLLLADRADVDEQTQIVSSSGQGMCDISMLLYEGTEISGQICYDATLFAPATIERLLGQYQTLLAAVVADPDQPLARLPLLTAAEAQQQLVAWNATAAPLQAELGVHTLIARQAARTPSAVAVRCRDQQLS